MENAFSVIADFTSTRTYWNAVISDESERHYVGLVDGSWTVNRGYICQYHCKLFSYCQVLSHRVQLTSGRVLDL